MEVLHIQFLGRNDDILDLREHLPLPQEGYFHPYNESWVQMDEHLSNVTQMARKRVYLHFLNREEHLLYQFLLRLLGYLFVQGDL